MDWLKRLIFTYEEEEEEWKTEKKDEQPTPIKELETRVSFHYPSHQLTKIDELKPSDHYRTDRSTSLFQRYPHLYKKIHLNKHDHLDEETVESRIEQRKKRRYVQDNDNKEVTKPEIGQRTSRYNGVFRPSEIPSPVFGFRKQEQSEVVEFELTSFEPNQHTVGQEQHTNNVSDMQKEHPNPKLESQKALQIEDGNEKTKVEEGPNPFTEEIEEQSVRSIELGAPDEFVTKEVENSIDYQQENEERLTDSHTVQRANAPVIDLSQEQEEENAPVEIEETYATQTDNETDEMKRDVVNQEDEIFEAKNEQKPRKDNEEATIKERPRHKRHIPFNVMMLKSDRERLLERERRRKQAKRETAATILEDQPKESSFSSATYQFPAPHLLRKSTITQVDQAWIEEQKHILNQTLRSFHVGAKVVNVSVGPAVTRFELAPDLGVKVSKIMNLIDDLKLSLGAKDIRIEAPIPGKHTIGIEVPNKISRPVHLREILDEKPFVEAQSPLTVGLGLDITGKPIVTDLKKMPHGLIAGATGSGKSVCINALIVSLLYKASPEDVRLLMIDPKMVELAPYNGIPHLISPVITNVKAATQSLKWAVEEMERRYELFVQASVRDIHKYNEIVNKAEKLPYIIIIIDELADLMMMAPNDVEEAIARIAQKARACGIHLIIATQRPSVDVITGLIKANIPTRIAFSVSSQVDSRTIIDMNGAERLLGKGDMLFVENGTAKPIRIQGAFITDEEIERVVNHVRSQGEPNYLFKQEELIRKSDTAELDELLLEACEYAVEQGAISTSSLQRHFRIGYNRAARIIETMEEKGMISEAKGSKPRDVFLTDESLAALRESL